VTGRVISVLSTLFVAGAIAWRARPAGWLVALTLGMAWLGSVPVLQWGSAVKPDLLALGLTVAAVVALDGAKPRHALSGALFGFAALAKPTALLPAGVVLLFVARRQPLAAARAAVALVIAALALAGRARLLGRGGVYPLAAIAQAAIALVLLNPFGVLPLRSLATGAWGDPDRIAVVARVKGTLLVEDSGLLLANGREPLFDD